MEEEIQKNLDNKQIINLSEPDELIKKKIDLVLFHDGLVETTIYINNILDKFGRFFNHIYLNSEDQNNLEQLKSYQNLSVVSSIKPINLGSEWVLILEPGEMPSIQLLNNLGKILHELDPDVKIIKLPIVVCNFTNGEIIDILSPSSRIFKQNPQLLQRNDNEEITIREYPIVKIYVDFRELES
jgi:hypothetical protein